MGSHWDRQKVITLTKQLIWNNLSQFDPIVITLLAEKLLFEYYVDGCEYECQFTQRKLDENSLFCSRAHSILRNKTACLLKIQNLK